MSVVSVWVESLTVVLVANGSKMVNEIRGRVLDARECSAVRFEYCSMVESVPLRVWNIVCERVR